MSNITVNLEKKAALLFQILPKFSPAIQQKLLEKYGSFEALLNQEHLGLPAGTIPAQIKSFRHDQTVWWDKVSRLIEICDTNNIKLIPITSNDYPQLLKTISSAPPLLFVQGAVQQLHLPQVAIIGSRQATPSGIKNAQIFARELTENGLTITSGMALGIDGAAHRGALEAGTTIAVMGTGLDIVYPRSHSHLKEDIIASGGVVVSEFLPGTPAKPQNFPRRNRIISGLSMGVLVIEAAVKSGSLITARTALQQGREVFALPGSIHNPVSRGCHQLIRDGATLVETTSHIIQELEGMLAFKQQESVVDEQPEQTTDFDKTTSQVFASLGFDPMDIDQLITQTGLSVAEVNHALLQLELAGVVDNRFGRVCRVR